MNEPSKSETFFAFLLMPFTMVLHGVVVGFLWTWFMTPLGLPVISVPMAMGISLLVVFMSGDAIDLDRSLSESATRAIVIPIWVLAVGFIISLFL